MHALNRRISKTERMSDLFRIGMTALCFCLMASAASAEAVPSRIKEVTLFPNKALIKREAVVTAGKGRQEILLEVDAYRIDHDSVSAKVFGDGEIFSVQFREMPLTEAPQEKIKALEQKLKGLKKARRALSDDKEVLKSKEQFVRSVIQFSEQQVPKEIKTAFPKAEDLEKILRFINANLQAINSQKQTIDGRIDDLDRDIKVAERDLATLGKRRPAGKQVIEIVFNSRKEQKLRIEADYVTQNASWSPLYKVTVPGMADAAGLTMFGSIRQKTGEDWERVALSVSNAVPLEGGVLPSLSSWIVDIERPRPKARAAKRAGDSLLMYKAAPAPAAEAMRDANRDEETEKTEASFTSAERTESLLAFEYKLPQHLSIESRDKETVLPLYTKSLQGAFLYYAVPRMNKATFLVMKASADGELLPGPLNVYFDGRFVGKTMLGDRRAGEEMHLNLGADREVRVQREVIRDKLEETLFGAIERSTVVRNMAYRIVMENLKKKEVHLQVMDSIPVSRSDKVSVKDMKIMPQPKEKSYQGRDGVLMWEEVLKPGEKKEIMVEFVVTYPKDMPVIGL